MTAFLQLFLDAAQRPTGLPRGPRGWELIGSVHTSILLLAALMVLLAWAGRREPGAAREKCLTWAWAAVFFVETLGVAFRTIPWFGPGPGSLHWLRTTIETAGSQTALVLLSAATVLYFAPDDRAPRRLMWIAGGAAALLAAVFIGMGPQGGGPPPLGPMAPPPLGGRSLGPPGMPREAAFIFISVLSLGAAAVLTHRRLPAAQRRMALAGCSVFAAADLVRLQILPAGLPRPAGDHPFSSTLTLIGLFVYAYLYVRERSVRHRSNIEALEERVGERTRELQTALDQLHRANALLVEQSTVDALTGVRNRRFFDEILREEWKRAQRSGESIALALVDLDDFKGINDRWGHPVGDDCLVSTATTLQTITRRPADVVARYGGDEFAVLLGGASVADAVLLLDGARRQVEELQGHAGAPGLSYTVSAGVASLRPDEAGEPAQLVQQADEALYRAKQLGRNRVAAAWTATSTRQNQRG